jgi:hypothetical protein
MWRLLAMATKILWTYCETAEKAMDELKSLKSLAPDKHWYMTNEKTVNGAWLIYGCEKVVEEPYKRKVRPMRRPMISFFDSLDDGQRQAVMNYRGPENHGSSDFKLPSVSSFEG